MSEQVLVIKKHILQPYIQHNSGCLFTGDSEMLIEKILDNQEFMERGQAEYDYGHKQVIPYVIIRTGGTYLLLRRTTGQTEKRLHNKYSLGIGGHINPLPMESGDNIILEGLYRELNEEVSLEKAGKLKFIGVINDESNSVSRVHLGLLYVLESLSMQYEVLETEKMTAEWIRGEDLKRYYNSLETWSQIVYDQYIADK